MFIYIAIYKSIKPTHCIPLKFAHYMSILSQLKQKRNQSFNIASH